MSSPIQPKFHPLLRWTLAGALATACFLPTTEAQQAPPKTTRTVVLENELVRVVEVRAEPGSQIEMREQPDKMVIVLEAAPPKNARPSRHMEWAQGETKPDTGAYKPAEGPATRGSVLNAARAIVVEFRQPAPKAARTPSLPPPYKAVSENAHAVQFEATAAPGQVTPLHTHSNHVLIALADGTVELTDPSGKKEKLELKKDTVKFGPPMTHTSANAGSTPLHWVLIELK